MLLAVLHFCQLMDNATVLNIQTGNLMFTPKKDQYLNTIEQTSFFKHNWLDFFLTACRDMVNQTNPWHPEWRTA